VLALDRHNYNDLVRLAPRDLPEGRLRMLRVVDPADLGASGDVPDPYDLDDSAYDHALDLIERACDDLVRDLVAELKPASVEPTVRPALGDPSRSRSGTHE